MSSSDSAQVKLVTEWGKGFQKKDLAILEKPLHKDFRHVTYPRSLGRPEQNKEEWLAQLAKIIPLWIETKASHFNHRTSFVAANPLPQETTHSVIEAPGKVIVHVRISNVEITSQLLNVVFISQFTNVTKTSVGIDSTYEAITIAEIVTDEGSLKIKKIEEFIDSKTFLDTTKAIEAAVANK